MKRVNQEGLTIQEFVSYCCIIKVYKSQVEKYTCKDVVLENIEKKSKQVG